MNSLDLHDKKKYDIVYVANDCDCMFNSLIYLLNDDNQTVAELRQSIKDQLIEESDIFVEECLKQKKMTLQEYKDNIVDSTMRGDNISLHCLARSLKTKIVTINPYTMEQITYPQKINEVDDDVLYNKPIIRILAYPYGHTLRVLPLQNKWPLDS